MTNLYESDRYLEIFVIEVHLRKDIMLFVCLKSSLQLRTNFMSSVNSL